jgi:hypothetical protein
MRFFRTKWLKRVLLLLLPLLLNAGSFGFIDQGCCGKKEVYIHAGQFLDRISSSVRQLQIKYGFDAVHVSVVPIFKKIISADYIPGTSFDPMSADLLTHSSRGPPSLIRHL